MLKTYNIPHSISILKTGTKIYKRPGCNQINKFMLMLEHYGMIKNVMDELARKEQREYKETCKYLDRVLCKEHV